MYQILCDKDVLYDPRDDELIVDSPKCKLETNTIGEASFSIYATHPYYGQLQKLKSIFEIRQDSNVIFRGRMTDDTRDFNNIKLVDLEGVMGFFNDSIIRPFKFPEDFQKNADYVAAKNKVEFFLKWLIDQHNAQVQPFQRFKLGIVTVSDPNNYLSRSSEDYTKTWEVLKSKLFDSSLGGYLCIRYEEDGNYIDYLEDFVQTNAQKIVFGENLLDITSESDASATYSAIIPLGKKKNEIDTESSDSSRLTIKELGDGDVTADIVKSGDTLYSKSAVEKYGFIYAPTSETTWEDVGEAANLQQNGVEWLEGTGMKLANTITIKAVDLHFSDDEIEAFRIYRYTEVESKPHDHEGLYKLTSLDIDIQNPQNTVITLGETQLGMTDINAKTKNDVESKINIVFDAKVNETLSQFETEIIESCEELFSTKIEQFSKSITLSLTGSLGSKASIVLSVDGNETTQELDLTGVRSAFANDKTAVTISGGTVTFEAGTLVINSSGFKVSSTGKITATSGTIGAINLTTLGIYSYNSSYSASYAGWYRPGTITTTAKAFYAGATSYLGLNAKFYVTYGGQLTATDAMINGTITTEYSSYKAMLDGGGLELYYSDVLCGTVNTKYWSGASTEGISLRVEEGGNYIMFSHADDTQGSGYKVDYYLNAGWSSNYDEMHIFQTSARFLDDVYFAGYTRIRSLRLFGSDGEYLVGINSNGQLTVSKL